MSARWVTGYSWQALLVWSSVSALPVPSPQRVGHTEVTGQQGMEVFKLTVLFILTQSQPSKKVSSLPFTVIYLRIRNNIPDKLHTAYVSAQMDVANKY